LGARVVGVFGQDMSKQTNSFARRCFPSLTDVAFVMPILLLFTKLGGVGFMLGDGDTGWHVRTGEWILRNGRVPDRDIFSFTKPGEPWFAWEWLWDVIFGWLHQHWGMAAVVVTSLMVISLTSALLYRLVRRKCPNVLIAFGVTFLAVAASSIHWLARPHLFTLLFVVVFYALLERAREGNLRLLWFLPPLTVVWTNLHGGFFVGIALILTYAAGELAGWILEPQPEDRRASLRRSRPLFFVAAACGLASLVNPYFYKLHVHIAAYLTDSFHFVHISEFQSLSFQHPGARYLELLILLAVVAAGWNLYRRRFVYVILLFGFAHLALFSARNVPIFAILAAPLVAEVLREALLAASRWAVVGWVKRAVTGFESFAAEVAENDARGRIPLASVAAAAIFVLLFNLPAKPQALRAEYDPKKYPEKALQMLRGQPWSRSIFTDDEWGDYVIYRLYPTSKVFVDGRSDFYGSKFAEKYIDVMNGKFDWKDTLDRYGVETVLLPVDASLASTLKESRDWHPVYDDGVAIVFRATGERAARAPRPESEWSPAATSGGVPVIARSPTITNPRDRKITSLREEIAR
jgi:hypothetical protein